MNAIRNIFFVLLGLNILGGVGLWFGYSSIIEAKKSEATLRSSLAAESQKTDQLSVLKRNVLLTKNEKEKLEKFLYAPNDEDQIRFISSIEHMGTSTSGAVVETSALDFTKTSPPTLVGDFTLKGTWSQLFHVLRLAEEFPSRVVVRRFDVKNGGAQSDWAGNIKIELLGIKTTE